MVDLGVSTRVDRHQRIDSDTVETIHWDVVTANDSDVVAVFGSDSGTAVVSDKVTEANLARVAETVVTAV